MFKSLLLTLIIVSCFSMPYRKVVHGTDPDEAKCLDGTPGILYIHEGGQKDKFLIFFEGGGLCAGLTLSQTTQECYKRSLTQLGSSKYRPDYIDEQDFGYLSTDPDKSKFATWTKVLVGYCDGSLHQGYRKSPIAYKGTSLYFRGAAVVRSHFKYLLKQFNLASASKVLITGISAGGIATNLWSNYLTKIVKDPKVVVSAPDSGVFFQFLTYKTKMHLLTTLIENNFKVANVDEKTPMQKCNSREKRQEWKCLFFSNSYSQIESRIMLINSQYDSWAINNTLQIGCITYGQSDESLSKCSQSQIQYIETYRKTVNTFISQKYLSSSKNSVWMISCAKHGYSAWDQFYSSNRERVNNETVRTALQKFVFDEQRVVDLDDLPWPHNAPCAY